MAKNARAAFGPSPALFVIQGWKLGEVTVGLIGTWAGGLLCYCRGFGSLLVCILE